MMISVRSTFLKIFIVFGLFVATNQACFGSAEADEGEVRLSKRAFANLYPGHEAQNPWDETVQKMTPKSLREGAEAASNDTRSYITTIMPALDDGARYSLNSFLHVADAFIVDAADEDGGSGVDLCTDSVALTNKDLLRLGWTAIYAGWAWIQLKEDAQSSECPVSRKSPSAELGHQHCLLGRLAGQYLQSDAGGQRARIQQILLASATHIALLKTFADDAVLKALDLDDVDVSRADQGDKAKDTPHGCGCHSQKDSAL